MAASHREPMCLIESLESSDGSFDIIDPNFDPAFAELTGTASADYIPMDNGEILLRKGDSVRIEEETLDRHSYMVTIVATGEQGKVPKDFINLGENKPSKPDRGSKFLGSINWESDEESNDSAPFKRTQGIVRRHGVERNKRPQSFKPRENGVDGTDSHPVAVQDSLKPPGNAAEAKGFSTSEQINPGVSAVARLRALTREDRALTLQQAESRPEFKLIEKYNILSVGGADRDGRPVIVLSACRLPPSYLIDHQRLLEYILHTLDHYVEQDYTFVYFHHGFSSANKPSLSWMKQVYKEMDRKYKKNIKKFYIVHPTNFIRVLYYLLKPLISYKFGQKLVYINRLAELQPVLYLDQIDIPDEVKRYDLTLTTSIRDVTHTESRSVFHVPVGAPPSGPAPSPTTQQFGVPLDVLRERHGGDPVPPVLKTCAQYIRENGLQVVGIFRRAPNNSLVHQVKRKLDRGERVEFGEQGDCHLPAVLMKLFLRELPEPLLTFQAYSNILDIRGKAEENRLQICQKVLSSLPETNYIVLRYLVEFLSQVAANQEVNKMTELNLAIVFGPNLIWSSNETANLASLGEINSFTLLLIQKFDLLFNK